MKKWTMFALLLMLFALSIALPEQGLPAESPKIEKASVKRDFIKTEQRYNYVFDFDVVNTLKQSIEIISINALDVSGNRIAQKEEIRGNPILSAGRRLTASAYMLSSKNKYDSLILRVAYKVNGKLQEVSRTFTVGMREEEKSPSTPVPQPVPTPTPPPSLSKAETPRFEKASVKRDFVKADIKTNERFWYIFDFDFVNTLKQSIEIISVNVFDMNRQKVEQDWAISGPNFDSRILTHALSGHHPLAEIFSKPRGTPLEQATVSSVGGRPEVKPTNRIMSPGQVIRPSVYFLSSKNNYDSLTLRVAYKVNGKLQEVSRTFTVGVREEEKPPSTPVAGKSDGTLHPYKCPGAAFSFPVPVVDNSGTNSFIGWLYKESTKLSDWPGVKTWSYEDKKTGIKWIDKSMYHSGLDFWASPGTPVMGQATGKVIRDKSKDNGWTIYYPGIPYSKDGNKKYGVMSI